MITIYDIAKECGCSSATVSKVFNRTGNISEKKRREVLEAAERLGYVPNVAARSLVRQRSNMVGVLLFIDESLGLRHGLFAEILNRFRAEMEKHNFEIVLISEKGEMWGGRFHRPLPCAAAGRRLLPVLQVRYRGGARAHRRQHPARRLRVAL